MPRICSKIFGALLAMLGLAGNAQAEIAVNLGLINVNPDSSESDLMISGSYAGSRLSVNDDTTLGFTFDYQLTDHWYLELVAALPFEHDIQGKDGLQGTKIGSTKQLPPIFFLQYQFGKPGNAFRPFTGIGINYTVFFSEDLTQELKNALGNSYSNADLDLDSSVGLAAQIGFNYQVNDQWGVHAMLSKADIDTDATVSAAGASDTTSNVAIDPLIFFIAAKRYF